MQCVRTLQQSGLHLVCLVLVVAFSPGEMCAQAQESTIELQPLGKNRLYRFHSDHFELYTDLEPRETLRVLDRTEAVVSNLGVFLGQPLKGKIKCFVVSDMNAWPAELLADSFGRSRIAEKAGAVVFERTIASDGRETARPVVYTVADDETPQRYVVQAFCWQNYGRVGTDWFAEGISEVGAYWQKEGGPHCPNWMADYLRVSATNSPGEVLAAISTPQQPWQRRAQRWALCFMLVSHPRYAGRFRQFSRDQLLGKNPDFARTFPEIDGHMEADYRKFLRQLPDHRDTSITAVE